MDATLFASIGYVVALTSGFAGIAIWKRKQALSQELDQVRSQKDQDHRQQERVLERNQSLETSLAQCEETLAKNKRDSADLEKQVKALQEHIAKREKEDLSQWMTVQNERDHFKSQTEALLFQIKELDSENTLLKKAKEQELQEKSGELSKSAAKFQSETSRLKTAHSQLEADFAQVQGKLKDLEAQHTQTVDLARRFKRKAFQSDHLYKTIRGQKDMLEERLENWEKALRLLSLWVLREQGQVVSAEAKLGEIVSAALMGSKQGPLFSDDVEMEAKLPVTEAPAPVEEAVSA